jgi:hypothetical protein
MLREIKTIEQLSQIEEADMLRTRGCGRKTINELKSLLAQHDLEFRKKPIPMLIYKNAKPFDFIRDELQKINTKLAELESLIKK